MLNKKTSLLQHIPLLIDNLQQNIISHYLYIVNDALINWGGLSDGSDLVAEEIG